jgi:hypothetical protein
MGMEWEHIGSGRRSTNNPASMSGGTPGMNGIYDNGMYSNQYRQVWVPDPAPPVNFTSTTNYHSSTGRGYVGSGYSVGPSVSVPMDWKAVWQTVKWTGILGVLTVVVWFCVTIAPEIVRMAAIRIFDAQPTITDSVYTYSADEVMKFSWLHGKNRPMHLNGRTVLVKGDISDTFVHVNGNVTFQGTLRNVNVVDTDWKITAEKAEHSVLTARQIQILGDSTGTTVNIVPSPAVVRAKRKR